MNKVKRREQYYFDYEGFEVPMEFQPYDDPLVERVGNKLVVAYLVLDSDPSNPMTDHDCNGEIVTRPSGRNRYQTDDERRLYRSLGLDSHGYPDIDSFWTCEPYIDRVTGLQCTTTNLRALAAKKFEETLELQPELIQYHLDAEGIEYDLDTANWPALFEQHREQAFKWLEDVNSPYSDDVEKIAVELYPLHWRDLAGPFVVPLDYQSYNDTHISVANWDGDPEEPPDAVWIACKCSEESFEGKAQEEIEKCVSAIISEYESYLNGDVYGCVVQTYEFEPTDPDCDDIEDAIYECLGEWVPMSDYDSCWSFIGHDYAEEALKTEFFEPVVSGLKIKPTSSQVPLPGLEQTEPSA